jgi:hypothetical protein
MQLPARRFVVDQLERPIVHGFHLWAGQAQQLAKNIPAGELVRRLADEARAVLSETSRRFGS